MAAMARQIWRWNFVHTCRLKEFVSYLLRCPVEREMKQLTYAYFESPDVIPADEIGCRWWGSAPSFPIRMAGWGI